MAKKPEVKQDEEASTAIQRYEMPEDVRDDLLRAQQESLSSAAKLLKIRMLPAAGMMFEIFENDEESRKVEEFLGVILGSHDANSLWPRPYGEQAPPGEENLPLCSSPDGKWGVPNEGFRHLALGGMEAIGTEHIECKTCPYNQWGSGNIVIATKNPKGKAVTNQKRVYVLLEGYEAPFALTLPSTSMSVLEEYLIGLLNKKTPVQAVVTEFSQVKVKMNGRDVAKIVLRVAGFLEQDQFQHVLDKRAQFKSSITPAEYVPEVAYEDATNNEQGFESGATNDAKNDEQDDLPF